MLEKQLEINNNNKLIQKLNSDNKQLNDFIDDIYSLLDIPIATTDLKECLEKITEIIKKNKSMSDIIYHLEQYNSIQIEKNYALKSEIQQLQTQLKELNRNTYENIDTETDTRSISKSVSIKRSRSLSKKKIKKKKISIISNASYSSTPSRSK